MHTFLTALCGPMGPRGYAGILNADGTMQWTPNSGTTGFNLVKDTSFDGDTTCIKAPTSGLVAQFEMETFAVASILAVQTSFVGRLDDAGIVDVNGQIIVNGTITNGASQSMVVAYDKFVDLYLTDPTTGEAWDPVKFGTAGVIRVGVNRTV